MERWRWRSNAVSSWRRVHQIRSQSRSGPPWPNANGQGQESELAVLAKINVSIIVIISQRNCQITIQSNQPRRPSETTKSIRSSRNLRSCHSREIDCLRFNSYGAGLILAPSPPPPSLYVILHCYGGSPPRLLIPPGTRNEPTPFNFRLQTDTSAVHTSISERPGSHAEHVIIISHPSEGPCVS